MPVKDSTPFKVTGDRPADQMIMQDKIRIATEALERITGLHPIDHPLHIQIAEEALQKLKA